MAATAEDIVHMLRQRRIITSGKIVDSLRHHTDPAKLLDLGPEIDFHKGYLTEEIFSSLVNLFPQINDEIKKSEQLIEDNKVLLEKIQLLELEKADMADKIKDMVPKKYVGDTTHILYNKKVVFTGIRDKSLQQALEKKSTADSYFYAIKTNHIIPIDY